MSTLLIDADILLYRSLAAAEVEEQWDDDMWSLTCDHNVARLNFTQMLDALVGDYKKYKLCFSDTANFRKEMNPTYKGNRTGVRKPLGFRDFRAEMIEKYEGIVKPTLEADDVIGILATKPGSDFIIVSADKDLMGIPGKHLVDGKVIHVSQEEADRFFLTQVLTGDPADGYPGCPGIGKAKVQKIFKDGHSWQAIVDAYVKAGLTEEDALLQARMARILRWEDWDTKEQKVKLWQPNS